MTAVLPADPAAPSVRVAHERFSLSRGWAEIASCVPLHLLGETDLANQVCDHRYVKLVEETLAHDFPVRYIVLYDKANRFRGAQPFFTINQNILAGVTGTIADLAQRVRTKFPSFLTLKTLMLGNPAGPGVLGALQGATESERGWFVGALAEALNLYARRHGVRIVVFKDFPARDRAAMSRLTDASAGEAGGAPADFIRLPSMPMTALNVGAYDSFEDYMNRSLSKVTRKSLRRKFRKTTDEKIELTVTGEVEGSVEEIYRLYLQVYERASLKFEKITVEYLRQMSRQMPDRARFFLWKRAGELVAASVTVVRFPDDAGGGAGGGAALYDLYLGMEYPLALDLSLYHLTMRDVIQWCIENKVGTYYSTPLNYDAKLHFRHRLVPQDLYVRHMSPVLNPAFQFAMRFAEPTRHDKILPLFANVGELTGP